MSVRCTRGIDTALCRGHVTVCTPICNPPCGLPTDPPIALWTDRCAPSWRIEEWSTPNPHRNGQHLSFHARAWIPRCVTRDTLRNSF